MAKLLDGLHAGGLPVGERALAFIIEAESNAAADEIIRQLAIPGKSLHCRASRPERPSNAVPWST